MTRAGVQPNSTFRSPSTRSVVQVGAHVVKVDRVCSDVRPLLIRRSSLWTVSKISSRISLAAQWLSESVIDTRKDAQLEASGSVGRR